MAKGRMINKQISVSEQVESLGVEGALLFTWLISHADDLGLIPYSPRTIKALVVPMFENYTAENIGKHLEHMRNQKLITVFSYKEKKYWRLAGFSNNQTLKKDRQPTTYLDVELCRAPKDSWIQVGTIMDPNGTVLVPEVKGSEVKGSEVNVRKESAERKPKNINPQPTVSDSLLESKGSLEQIAQAREKLKGKLLLNGFAILLFLFTHVSGSYATTFTVHSTIARDVKKSAFNLLGQKAKSVPSTQDKIAGKEATLRRKWSDIEIARYIKSKSWPYETAIKLAKSENYWNKTKSFDCSRIGGRNKDGSYDTGIFQINSIHAPRLAKLGMTLEDMKDCKKNIDYAHDWLYKFQGFAPWMAYKNGSYLSHLPIDL